jgi:hypothetical protein
MYNIMWQLESHLSNKSDTLNVTPNLVHPTTMHPQVGKKDIWNLKTPIHIVMLIVLNIQKGSWRIMNLHHFLEVTILQVMELKFQKSNCCVPMMIFHMQRYNFKQCSHLLWLIWLCLDPLWVFFNGWVDVRKKIKIK